jgi:hypothetical protein
MFETIKKLLVDFAEDTVMVSACYIKAIFSILLPVTIASYLIFADGIFTISIFFLGVLYLYLSYKFYIKNINESRDILLGKLEKKGRKELEIDKDAEAFRVFNKVSSCQLPAQPANAKEFYVCIVYLGKEHLTIYRKCPKSHIFKIEKKKPPGKKFARPKEVAACGESVEYYYSYIQAANFDGKNVIIELNSGATEVIPAAKGPGKKLVNKVRHKLRVAEKYWNDHARGNFLKPVDK